MASIYVGTYAKYSAGNLFGAWVDPEDFISKEDFIEACHELHGDEDEPELMFQDWEEVPLGMVTESSVAEELWDWLALSESDRRVVCAYRREVDSTGSIEQALDEFRGVYLSEEDWARETMDATGDMDQIPLHLRGYIDFEAYARDARYSGTAFVRAEGGLYVFG